MGISNLKSTAHVSLHVISGIKYMSYFDMDQDREQCSQRKSVKMEFVHHYFCRVQPYLMNKALQQSKESCLLRTVWMLNCKVLKWLIGWLFTVLHPAQEFFTFMETSSLLVKGFKFKAYARRSLGPLRKEGSLSWHGASVFPVSFERPPHSVASYNTLGDVEDLF
jgi:hypothetical protein